VLAPGAAVPEPANEARPCPHHHKQLERRAERLTSVFRIHGATGTPAQAPRLTEPAAVLNDKHTS